MVNAQQWLDNLKSEVEKITSEGEKLEGELTISNFSKLKWINLRDAGGITKLKIKDCPNIEEILTYNNQIEVIEGIEQLSKLRRLEFAKNRVKEIDVSQNKELVYLVCHGNQGLQVKGLENTSYLSFLNGGWTNEKKRKIKEKLKELCDYQAEITKQEIVSKIRELIDNLDKSENLIEISSFISKT